MASIDPVPITPWGAVIDHVTPVSLVPNTVESNCSVAPAAARNGLALAGALTVMVTGVTVAVAVPQRRLSTVLQALMVTVSGLGTWVDGGGV